MSWRDKVKQGRLPEEVVKLTLRGDLAAEHEQLVEQIEQVRERGSSSLAGNGTAALKARIREIEAEAADSVVAFKLRALPRAKRAGDDRPTWRELADLHPPRVTDGVMDARDRIAGGVNRDTFPEPMVRACLIALDDDEDPPGDADWAELVGGLTDGQFDALVNACWGLNRGVVDVPFWSDGSKQTSSSALG